MLNKLKSLFYKQPEPVPVSLIEKTPMTRAVGFCRTEGCADFNKGKFLFSQHSRAHICVVCRAEGMVIEEKWSVKYPGNMDFYQVRLEFNFRPSLIPEFPCGTWKGLVIVSDMNLPDTSNVYYMKSPLISTEKRALQVAESMLSGLLRDPEYIILRNGNRPAETQINFDAPLGTVKSQLWEFENKLRNSRLSEERNG